MSSAWRLSVSISLFGALVVRVRILGFSPWLPRERFF
jgi:hypothetical protein